MRFFAGLLFGFIAGCCYALYQTVEKPDGLPVKIMEGIKAITGVL
ncbi:hypothetical protein [Virgibacillus halodenitrificans]|nr:hypothetical protein [Virgibacillus halodenitrificans]